MNTKKYIKEYYGYYELIYEANNIYCKWSVEYNVVYYGSLERNSGV